MKTVYCYKNPVSIIHAHIYFRRTIVIQLLNYMWISLEVTVFIYAFNQQTLYDSDVIFFFFSLQLFFIS